MLGCVKFYNCLYYPLTTLTFIGLRSFLGFQIQTTALLEIYRKNYSYINCNFLARNNNLNLRLETYVCIALFIIFKICWVFLLFILSTLVALLGLAGYSVWGVWLQLWVGTVQVATLASPTNRETEDYMGIQDSFPWCPIPSARQKDYLRGRWSGAWCVH